jgi:glycine cleavage system aminomethyltransferase T
VTDGSAPSSEGMLGRIVVDGKPIAFEPEDSVAIAMIRAGIWPGRGRVCLAGDCGNCIAEVDGIAYERTCQVAARAGVEVRSHPADGKPPFRVASSPDLAAPIPRRDITVRRVDVDVAVIGAGTSGMRAAADAEAAGRSVITLDAGQGIDVMGIYPGPTIVARERGGILHVRADDVIVATGAADLQSIAEPTVDASFTPRAAAIAAEHGIPAEAPASTGLVARDVLVRMAPADGSISVVGTAAETYPLPPAPSDDGVVCPCMGTTLADLKEAFDRGYDELELLKRASWAGLGTCQGGVCLPHVRAFLAERTGVAPEPFTARPGARQITIGEAAADTHIDAFRRTALHDEHLAAGARMDRFGGWWRPWHYGDPVAEYWAVREGVSIGDVSTLGKLIVSGPDVVELLERLYPCHVADIKVGRSRYALLLNERGHVMDDGMILRDDDARFTLTFTSGGAANAEMWIRDWIDTWGLRVHVMDRTMSLAAINVTGPLAKQLLVRLGLEEPPRFLGHVRGRVSDVPVHAMRLSFTGEAAWELHHPLDRSVELWRSLMAEGRDLGIRPHGLQALFGLRLEKGHVIVGMDTELDTTPRRLGMDWAVRMDKADFIGRAALARTAKLDDDRRWMGFSMDGPAPVEGTPIYANGAIIGNVTGSWSSPLLGRALMLGWQKRQPWADVVEIDGREAWVTPTPFYDPEGTRARA